MAGESQSAKASSEVTSLIRAAVTAKQNFDQARQDFFDSYENKKIKVADDVFKYIKSRNALVKELQQLSDDMVALQEAQQSMSVVTASSAGYVVGLDIKSGDVYSGDKILYTIAKEEDKPVLRADVTDLKKDVSEGAKVEVQGDYSTYRTKVSQIVNDSDGRKYAEMEMTDDILYAAGGMSKLMENGSIDAKIVFRSRKNAHHYTRIGPALRGRHGVRFRGSVQLWRRAVFLRHDGQKDSRHRHRPQRHPGQRGRRPGLAADHRQGRPHRGGRQACDGIYGVTGERTVMAIKAFWKERGKLLFLLALAVAVIVYAAVELNGLPGVYQHVFLPGEQLAETEGGQPVNRYLRDLVDKKESADTALDGSCEPTTLYAVAQPPQWKPARGKKLPPRGS